MKPIISLLFTLLAFNLYGQNLSSIDRELTRYVVKMYNLAAIDNYREQDSISKYDSLLETNLSEYLNKYPTTITYSFDSLRSYIGILSSDDGFLRIYSWDNLSGGTARNYTSIIQYKSNQNVLDTELESNNPLFEEIYTVKGINGPYYIAHCHQQLASFDYVDLVKAYSIKNGILNDSIKVFKTSTGLHNSISYEWHATGTRVAGAGYGRTDYSIDYNQNSKTINIPLVKEDGTVTLNYIHYKFNGSYFLKEK